MLDIIMLCDNPECICEDVCCQTCDKRFDCEGRCKNIRYKERICSDDEYLLEKLEMLVNQYDDWHLGVTIEKMKSYSNVAEVIARNLVAWDALRIKMNGLLPEVYLANKRLYHELVGEEYSFISACKRFGISC